MAKDNPKTLADAFQYLRNSHSEYRKMLRNAVRKRGYTIRTRLYLDGLLGNRPVEGPILASDLKAWHEIGGYVVEEVDRLHNANPHLEFYHVTLLADEGLLYDRNAYVPIEALRKKVHNSLSRKLGVSGLAVIECQGLTNWPQKKRGRTLMVHVHVLIWFDKRKIPKGVTNTEFGVASAFPSRTWSSAFDARPVTATKITPARGSPAFWAAYIMKCPHKAKRRTLDKAASAKSDFPVFKLKSVSKEDGYRPEFALRIYEMRTHLGTSDLIIGVGDGALMKRRCETRLRRWEKKVRKYRRESMRIFNIDAFRRLIKKNRRVKYREFFIG